MPLDDANRCLMIPLLSRPGVSGSPPSLPERCSSSQSEAAAHSVVRENIMAMLAVGKWCLGHGVVGQAESLRVGHYVEGHLVPDVLSVHNARGSKGLAPTVESRCAICRSIRRWHDHGAAALRRAGEFRRKHAKRWVKKGRHPTVEAALLEMDVGGLTVEAIASVILDAIGEPCPGMCAHEENGKIVFHTIDSVADMHIDVRDPNEPFSLENIGILCRSCNLAKGPLAWARHIFRRRAALRAWQDAIDHADYRRPEQGRLDL